MDKLERVRKAQLALVKRELAAAEKLSERKASFVEATDRLEQLIELAGKFRQTQESIEQQQEDTDAIASVHDHREEFNQAYYAARNLLEKYIAVNKPDETGSSASGGTVDDGTGDLHEALRLLLNSQRTLMENQRSGNARGNLDPAGDHTPNVRLPAINVPMFSGERKDWSSFKNLYTTTIHNRTDLSPSVKMQYLFSYLENAGNAKKIVCSYSISDVNYLEAWNALTNYYDKKKFTVFALVREFMEQPTVVVASSSELRKLAATSDEVVRQLDALGDEFNTRDPWLIHLLLKRLDDETCALWAQRIVNVDNPSFDDFLQFLDNRCDALETCATFTNQVRPDVIEKETVKKAVSEKVQSMHLAIAADKCAKCSKEHPVHRCDEFKKMDLRCKRKLVMQARLCYNCLRPYHMARACSSKSVCRNVDCGQRHHTLLCQQRKLEKHFIATDPEPESQPSNWSTVALDPVEKLRKASVLPTAVVRIRKSDGSLLPVRALIDSGSEASLISKTCFNKLGLARSNDKIEVTGIGRQAAGTANGLVNLAISNRFSDATLLQTKAYVVGNLTSTLPTQLCEVHPRLLDRKLKSYLADPAYQRPGSIDLILGADVFLTLLLQGQIKDSGGVPVAQNTIFGWIASGCQTNILRRTQTSVVNLRAVMRQERSPQKGSSDQFDRSWSDMQRRRRSISSSKNIG